MAHEEWRLRVQLAACYRVFDHLGWIELVFNHITLRVPGDRPAYLINPFGLNYREVMPLNLIKVGLDGVPLEPSEHPTIAGFVIHSAVHVARRCALRHAHPHDRRHGGRLQQAGLGHDDSTAPNCSAWPITRSKGHRARGRGAATGGEPL